MRAFGKSREYKTELVIQNPAPANIRRVSLFNRVWLSRLHVLFFFGSSKTLSASQISIAELSFSFSPHLSYSDIISIFVKKEKAVSFFVTEMLASQLCCYILLRQDFKSRV